MQAGVGDLAMGVKKINVECPMCDALVPATLSADGSTAKINGHITYTLKHEPVKCTGSHCTVMV